ncbi:MAG: hypothetical protein ACHQQ3_05540 [Gemmatimonadales bacterium]
MRRFIFWFRGPGERRRRVISLAMLALQGVIAVSPLWEPTLDVPLRSHAERHAARHPGMHNEATCAVCAVRLLSASLPVRAVHFDATAAQVQPVVPRASAPARRDAAPANLSRAPPLAG